MRTPTPRFLVAIALATVVFSPAVSFGQLGRYAASSLELLVAKAEVVVRGSVVNVTREPDKGDWGWDIVTLQVRDTLKGGKAKRLKFAIRTHDSDDTLQRWKESKQEALWLLDRQKVENGEDARRLAKILERHRMDLWTSSLEGSALRLGPSAPEDRRRPPPPIFTLDLRLLDTPEDIVKAARQAVETAGERTTRVHELTLSRDIMQRTGTSGDINFLRVPVDWRLEVFARRLIESPEDFLSPIKERRFKDEAERRFLANLRQGEKDGFRHEGVRALRYFKSRENIARLKPLLKDETWLIESRFDDRRDAKRVYYIREAAYEVLRQWGVEVGKPVLREDLPKKDKVKTKPAENRSGE
jgi:hypothetical protein